MDGAPARTAHPLSSEAMARKWATVLFWTVLSVAFLIVYYVVSVFVRRPWFSSCSALVFGLLWNYLTNPDSFWHKSQVLENQFWMLVTFLTTTNAFFAPDSPYLATTGGLLSPGLGRLLAYALIFATTLAAHVVDKHQHRTRLRRRHQSTFVSTLQPSSAAGGQTDLHDQALSHSGSSSSKLRQLEGLLSQLDRSLPSTLHTLWNISQYVRIEREILGILTDCSKDELNDVVLHAEMKLLAYKLKNHNKSTPASRDVHSASVYGRRNRSRSTLMDILAVRRISDLSLAARAVVLDVITSLRLTVHPDTEREAQEWIANVLLGTKGDELSSLKQLVDNKGSAESMHKLVYIDITIAALRRQILDHFRQQASVQAALINMRSSLAKKRLAKGPWRKILSDVDDTLFSSGGRYPAGIDTSYKRKVFYPGVTSLYRELDLGTVGEYALSGYWPPHRFGDLVFLSARPHVYKDFTETTMYTKFAGFIKTQGLHSMPSLLPGDLESGQAFVMKGDFMPMALKKMKNFEQYYSIYPEFTHVFIGDNGQADVKAAELMVEKFGRTVVERVYIHEVQPQQYTFGYEPGVSEERWARYGIIFCKTYVAAAVHAAYATDNGCKPLILPRGMHRIIIAARQEFAIIKRTWRDPYERDMRRIELNHDIALANARLGDDSLPAVDLIPGECVFTRGTLVYTPFGKGYVANYRPHDGIYEVVLTWNLSSRNAPRLFATLHSVFSSERTLREVRAALNASSRSKRHSASNVTPSRTRSATVETEGSLTSAAGSPARRLNRQSNTGTPTNAVGAAVSSSTQLAAELTEALETLKETRSPPKAAHMPPSPAPIFPRSAAMFGTFGGKRGNTTPTSRLSAMRRRATAHPPATGVSQAIGEDAGGADDTTVRAAGPKAKGLSNGPDKLRVTFPGEDRAAGRGERAPSSAHSQHSESSETDLVALPRTVFDMAVDNDASSETSSASGIAAVEVANRSQVDTAVASVYYSEPRSRTSAARSEQKGGRPTSAGSARRPRRASTSLPAYGVAEEPESMADVLEVGARVDTPFGKGSVLYFREPDEIYQVALKRSNMTLFCTERSLIIWNPKLFNDRADAMFRGGSYPRRLFGLLRNLFVRDSDGNAITPPSPGRGGRRNAVLVPDTIVRTPYGQGNVESHREADGMYEVRLRWGATVYLTRNRIDDRDGESHLSFGEAAELVKRESSPLQKARELVTKSWPFSRLSFGAARSAGSTAAGVANPAMADLPPKAILPNSASLVSLCSMASMTSLASMDSSSSFFSFPEDNSRLAELWTLQPGDTVDTNRYGVGTLKESRPDGVFVVQLAYGVAYLPVPRLLTSKDPVGRSTVPIPVGTRVSTSYGLGVVHAFRDVDNIYEVKLQGWNATAYIRSTATPRRTSMSLRAMTDAEPIKREDSTSFGSSILSFISNIIPGTASPSAKFDADGEGPGNAEAGDAHERHILASPQLTEVPSSHTTFSWQQSDPPASKVAKIPPGHTSFSWTALQSPGR